MSWGDPIKPKPCDLDAREVTELRSLLKELRECIPVRRRELYERTTDSIYRLGE